MGKLFQPFVQLDSSLTRQYEGTGLGLALVKRLADMQNGAVSVESTPGQGSRFTVSLPWSGLSEPNNNPNTTVAEVTSIPTALSREIDQKEE
jgi:signal transduction histidine kinase